MGVTKFMCPILEIRGKVSGRSNIILRRVGGTNKVISYVQGERDNELHPETEDEKKNRQDFGKISQIACARLKKTSPTYEADRAAYEAQLMGKNPIMGYRKWIWSLVKAEIAA